MYILGKLFQIYLSTRNAAVLEYFKREKRKEKKRKKRQGEREIYTQSLIISHYAMILVCIYMQKLGLRLYTYTL